MQFAHRSNTPVLFAECQQLVVFPCVIHLLQGDVSVHSKNVEKEGEIRPLVLGGPWYAF